MVIYIAGVDCVSRQAFQVCGDAEGVIAMETLQLEVEVENQILQRLSSLVDVDIPNIQKLRKQLTSRTLDMDSARARCLCVCLCLVCMNSFMFQLSLWVVLLLTLSVSVYSC